tara:strand:- start:220 stop:519 length:300 start_codon:yes stop_codon:yes gene_type:complete
MYLTAPLVVVHQEMQQSAPGLLVEETEEIPGRGLLKIVGQESVLGLLVGRMPLVLERVLLAEETVKIVGQESVLVLAGVFQEAMTVKIVGQGFGFAVEF